MIKLFFSPKTWKYIMKHINKKFGGDPRTIL